MSKTHTYTPAVTSAAGQIAGTAQTFTGGTLIEIDEAIIANQTNLLVALVLDVSQIQSIIIMTTVNMTLEFNNSTTGVPTMTMIANEPYIWNTKSQDINKLATDVTSLYVTNTTAGTLKISVILDPTV